uniref:t-SNARE coiled-coil homology domain-containing protein n=1 Tax=Soboliphyme baturini TaxID=241478 RepID=A0A183JAV9_9BILA
LIIHFTFRRRSSVTVAKSSFQAILEERLKKLHGIWNEVGLDQEQRRNRMSTAIAYLEKLLDQMLTEEGEMLETLKPNDDKPLISLMYDLQTQLQSLQDEKEKRIIQHQCLVEREIELCSKLGRQPTATDLQSPLKQNNLTQLSDKIAALQKLHVYWLRFFEFIFFIKQILG